MQIIDTNNFKPKINNLWANRWLLLTAGDFEKNDFNTMTVAWGYFGTMWNKPTAVAVVRPTRYTYKFMEKYDDFTLCSFDEQYRDDLSLLGTKSGRDGDKIAETNLTPCASNLIAAPGFAEANLLVECRKLYFDDFKPENFLDESIEKAYPKKDYHRIYIGEIVQIRGDERYQ